MLSSGTKEEGGRRRRKTAETGKGKETEFNYSITSSIITNIPEQERRVNRTAEPMFGQLRISVKWN